MIITLLPGDGIGPEIVTQARRVIEALGLRIEIQEGLIGGAAIDKTGSALPDETVELCNRSDAVLLGAVGGPKWDGGKVRPEQGLLALRKTLGVFANLRPITVHPKLAHASPLKPELVHGIDIMVVRELTGGIYFGEKKRDTASASDLCTYTVGEIERVTRCAALLARKREGRLTSVDKANVLETSRLWREVVTRVIRDEFPDVELTHMLVDACAMHLIRRPADFDVIVTENMFGDILTDEASMISGSIGLLPSASLGEGRQGLYEPIHGSAPDIAGKGIANPIGTILSAAMMLRHSLGMHEAAQNIELAVHKALENGVGTPDIGGDHSTAEVGNMILNGLNSVIL